MIPKKPALIILLLLGLGLLFPLGGEEAPDPGEERIVYVSPTGKKFHRENCASLKKGKRPLTLAEAQREGYAPCSTCKPLGRGKAALPEGGREEGIDLYNVSNPPLASSSQGDVGEMSPALVYEVVDGDTLKIRFMGKNAPREETVRLLGVDTPETVHPRKGVERFGKEASAFTRKSLLGKRVFIARDWDLRDRYGRLLAYVYTAGGGCFNAALVREGYAHAYTRYNFQFMEEFRKLEGEARREKRGLWGG